MTGYSKIAVHCAPTRDTADKDHSRPTAMQKPAIEKNIDTKHNGQRPKTKAANTQDTAARPQAKKEKKDSISNPFTSNKPSVSRVAKRSQEPHLRTNTSRETGKHGIHRNRTTKRTGSVRNTAHANTTVRADN